MRATTLLAALASAAWLSACAGGEEGKVAPATNEAAAIAVQCDKVTTFVCPGDPCLCKMVNCTTFPSHDGDFVPCNGPPLPGCQFDFFTRYCFPPGVAIPCDAAHVPVNRCGYPCKNTDPPIYTPEANGCCRGVRICLPPDPQPIDPIEPFAAPLNAESGCTP